MTLEYLTVAACEELAVGADQVNDASMKTKDKDASNFKETFLALMLNEVTPNLLCFTRSRG